MMIVFLQESYVNFLLASSNSGGALDLSSSRSMYACVFSGMHNIIIYHSVTMFQSASYFFLIH